MNHATMLRELIFPLLRTTHVVGRCWCWRITSLALTFVVAIDGFSMQQHKPPCGLDQLHTTMMSRHHKYCCNVYNQNHSDKSRLHKERRTFINLYSKDQHSSGQDDDPIYFNDFDDDTFNKSTNDNDDNTEIYFWNQLRMRQRELLDERNQRNKNVIKSGDCTSKVGIAISNDWIRRISIHTYPYAILGTSSDHIYLANIETGKIWGTSKTLKRSNDWSQSIMSQRLQYVTQQMFGMYDGGGTLAVAIYYSLLFEATRDGNVNIYRFDVKDISANSKLTSISDGGTGVKLTPMGNFPSLKGCIVTSLYCSNDNFIWIGTDAGRVEVYKMQCDSGQEWELVNKQHPYRVYQTGNGRTSISLSIHVHPLIKCAVVTSNTGSIDLLYYGDGIDGASQKGNPIVSFTPPFIDTMERRAVNAYPTCASIITRSKKITATATDDSSLLPLPHTQNFAIISGSNDGRMFLQELRTNDTMIYIHDPLVNTSRAVKPFHFKWVKCISTMGSDGLLLTGALDGTIRLWDIESSVTSNVTDSNIKSNGENINMKMIYQLMGYKVWMGSIWSDGIRIISDGADNAIIVHDFTKALQSTTPLSIRSDNKFIDNDEDPFEIDDRKRKPPRSPRTDGDSPDEYPII